MSAASGSVNNAESLAVKVNGGKPIQKFGLKDRIGYAFGDFGTTLMMGMLASFSSIYVTNILGISPLTLSTLTLITTFLAMITDVTAGRLSDLTPLGKKGRFHPWIRTAKWFLGLSILLMYLPMVRDWAMGAKVAYWFIINIFYVACLSSFNMPYGTLASVLSNDPHDRDSLSVFRNIGSALGAGGTGFIVPFFVYSTKGGQQVLSGDKLFICTIVAVVLAMIFYSIMYHMTTERIVVEHPKHAKSFTFVKGIFKDKALLIFILAQIFIVIGTSYVSFMTNYMYVVYFQNSHALAFANLFNYANTLLLSFIALPLTKKYGKKKVVSIALFASAFIFLLVYFLKLHDGWVYLALSFCSSLCFSMFNIMTWAFMTDVSEYHEYLTGNREDGTIYSVNMLGRKIAQAVNGFGSGAILTAIGYQATTSGQTHQLAAVLDKMYTLSTLVPFALLLIGACILAFVYPLGKEKLTEVTATLNKRRMAKKESK